MRQIRVQKQKVVHRHALEEVPPLDPRDPDVLRAKRLQREARPAPRARAA